MEYSFNLKRDNFVFAQKYEINASFKDMGAVCDAIRYLKAQDALEVIDRLISMQRPILFRKHNKGMGSRSELGGKKGAYPIKAGKNVRTVVVNAIANANSRGLDGNDMYIIHACANKTHIESRQPSKGSLAWGRGMYGRSAMMHSDLEYAKVEIALAQGDEEELTANMKYFITKKNKELKAWMKMRNAAAPKKAQGAIEHKAKSEKKHEHKHSHEEKKVEEKAKASA